MLAARSGTDPRTCERALREGPDVVRGNAVRAAIVLAAEELGITLVVGAAANGNPTPRKPMRRRSELPPSEGA